MEIHEALAKAAEGMESPPASLQDETFAPSADSTPEPVEAVETPAEPTEKAPEAPKDRARDEGGKFAKPGEKPATKAPQAPEKAKAEVAPVAAKPEGEKPAAPAVKAPQSWKPQATEAFAKAPIEVQQEVQRRETEIARTLQETAEVRKTMDTVRQTLAPYEGLARAAGMDPIRYAGSIMQTAAVLRQGSPAQKAGVIASLIASEGIDIDAINAYMQGQPAPQSVEQSFASRTANAERDIGRIVEEALQSRIQQSLASRASNAWEEFQASEPEFLDSVKDQMRLILNDAGQRGKNMTYQQAYDTACRLNEDVSSVLEQRKAAAAVRTPGTVTGSNRAAASSVRSTPAAPPNGAQPRSVQGALAAAAEKIGWRG